MTVFDECQFVNQQNMTNISMVAQKSIKKENACICVILPAPHSYAKYYYIV
jgi:hypothetical protein